MEPGRLFHAFLIADSKETDHHGYFCGAADEFFMAIGFDVKLR
jgi:hypothetical protein